ncbi:FUSC family protein [Micromonospora sp. RTGN7]|uniref:FUSC family protein n=1 Tax=Micromonospora sp. RTGN7 TaxID=3016526 RepID=UPI0029FEEAC7|nr:FUSC family protein [Micromonospora sp. RTGN7]
MVRWGWFRQAAGRLRRSWTVVVEGTLAATVSWLLATWLLGHSRPFFAPAAALIVLGQARGHRTRRALEVLFGVAAGVFVADVLVQALGPGRSWTIFIVILITFVLAVAFGAGSVTVQQAAVSALYVVVVSPPTESLVPFRFVDALIGGVVALVVSQIVGARHPLVPLAAEFRRIFGDLAGLLGEVAAALEAHDEAAARATLDRARGMDAGVQRLRAGVRAAGEALTLRVRRRSSINRLHSVDASIGQIDSVVRNVRALARAGVILTRLPSPAPDGLGAAIRSMAEAVHAAGEALAADLDGRKNTADGHAARAETAALEAVRGAGRLPTPGGTVPLAMIVGHLRTTAVDLLRGIGVDDDAALGRIDEALGLPAV